MYHTMHYCYILMCGYWCILVCGIIAAPPLTTHKPPAGSPGAAKNQVIFPGAKY